MKYFGTNGIRGIANADMNANFVLEMGKAIAKVLGSGRIAIAKDTRLSSDILVNAVSSGVMSMGTDVVYLGLVPTPALQLFVKNHPDVTGGVMITASHNPPEFNGIKCISADGTECSPEEESLIEQLYDSGTEPCSWQDSGRMYQYPSAGTEYIDSVVSKVDVDLISSMGFTACLDCSNGAACGTSPELLSRLGVRTYTMNGSPDGMFPGHESEPVESNLEELKSLTKMLSANIGIAHDGDADRCVFVTKTGRYVPGDAALAILARAIVPKGGKVVTTVATSSVVDECVEEIGGETIHTEVGSPKVARRMMSEGAVFGGEENGGIIFSDHQYCRDGAMAIARMLEAIARNGPLDEQLDSLPKYHTIKTAIICPDNMKGRLIDEIICKHNGERMNLLDGLRIDYDDGWVLMRPSGTEPKFRIYSESKDKIIAEKRSRLFVEEAEGILGDLIDP